jgi:hypothetical protein
MIDVDSKIRRFCAFADFGVGGNASRGRSGGGDKPGLRFGGCHNKQTYISFQLMTILLLCREFPAEMSMKLCVLMAHNFLVQSSSSGVQIMRIWCDTFKCHSRFLFHLYTQLTKMSVKMVLKFN